MSAQSAELAAARTATVAAPMPTTVLTPEPTTELVLTLDCPEAPGIVHAVTGILLAGGCNIIDNQQFGDQADSHFYMRVHVAVAGAGGDDPRMRLRADLEQLAAMHGMTWSLEPAARRRRVLVMVSKFDHCLNDLLYRARTGDLPIDIRAVVSNHEDHAGQVAWHDIPFHHVPVTPETKAAAERRLLKLIDQHDVELVVLARYMQVLSDAVCARLDGRVINIHHSFLPSFKGAKPYHQAHARGVKLVGATAHYVTADLDEGPIIAQEVIDVDHRHQPDDLVSIGRDAEVRALSKAVRWHCEGRVVVRGHRTVVLR